MARLRVGVVGVGHLGKHHARILAGFEGVELVGVVDARIEQARAVAEPLGTQAFADYHALLEKVEAVVIAVPTSLHRAVAGAFLERRIPTLVEKPLAGSLREAEELVQLARERAVVLQVGHIERFNPAFTALGGSDIAPKYVHAERLGMLTFRSMDIGVVHDLMIHDLDLLLALVSTPVHSVSAVGVSLFGALEDVANARIEFEDGCVANLTASRASFQALRKMRVWGPEGYATLDFTAKQTTFVRPSERLLHGQLDLEGLDLSQPAAVREHLFGKVLRVDQSPPAENREALALELEDFIRAVQGAASPRVPGTDALRAMRLADQIVRGLESHQWEGRPDGPVGPRGMIAFHEGSAAPPAPKSWRFRHARRGAANKPA